MSRVIKLESAGKDRTRLSKTLVLALRALMRQQEADDLTRDLTAYIILALSEIGATIEPSVQAWEKRGYWVKADRFRMEWEWVIPLAQKMRQALLEENWAVVAESSAALAGRLVKVNVPERNRLGEPWHGAYQQLIAAG